MERKKEERLLTISTGAYEDSFVVRTAETRTAVRNLCATHDEAIAIAREALKALGKRLRAEERFEAQYRQEELASEGVEQDDSPGPADEIE